MKRFSITNENRAEVMPRIGEYLKNLNCEKPHNVTIGEEKETRRSRQNRLYWKWVSIIGDDIGYERKDMHDVLVYDILGMITKTIHGKEVKSLASTHDLKVGEFSDYMERVNRFAANLGINLPSELV